MGLGVGWYNLRSKDQRGLVYGGNAIEVQGFVGVGWHIKENTCLMN